MIIRGGIKEDVFLRQIAGRINPTREDYGLSEEGSQTFIYFGEGYWRGMWLDEGHQEFRLINPGRPQTDVNTVEHGLAILLYCDYR